MQVSSSNAIRLRNFKKIIWFKITIFTSLTAQVTKVVKIEKRWVFNSASELHKIMPYRTWNYLSKK